MNKLELKIIRYLLGLQNCAWPLSGHLNQSSLVKGGFIIRNKFTPNNLKSTTKQDFFLSCLLSEAAKEYMYSTNEKFL